MYTDDEMTPKAPTKPKFRTVRGINAIQLSRLKAIIGKFKLRDKKLLYIAGRLQADESVKHGRNYLKLTDDREAKICRVTRTQEVPTPRSYGKASVSELGQSVDEHSALDLFDAACKLLPGFEAASARRYQEKGFAFVAKKASAPVPYDGSEPPLRFESPLLERSEIQPSEMCNTLAIGSTGSGKTVSFVMPALNSMLDYRLDDGKTATLLVVDPKVELLAGVQRRLRALGELDRLTVIGQCSPINYFDDADGLSVADRFEKLKGFTSITSSNSDDNRWQVFAEQLILCFLRDDQAFANVSRLPLLESVAAMVSGEAAYLQRNQWVALRKILQLGMESPQNLRHIADTYDVLTLSVGLTKMERPLARYANIRDGGDQFFYNARGALGMVDVLGSEDLEPILDVSVRRGLNRGNRTDIADLVERGAVLLFQPRQTATHDLMARGAQQLAIAA